MNSHIIKKLFMLRAIAPDREATERIKRLILEEGQGFSVRVLWTRQPVWVRGLAYAAIILILVMIPVFSVNRAPSLSSLKDSEKLAAEAAGLPISIELQEINYQLDRNEVIGAAITEIRDTDVRHLKNDIIESEIKDLSPSPDSREEINKLLEQVTS